MLDQPETTDSIMPEYPAMPADAQAMPASAPDMRTSDRHPHARPDTQFEILREMVRLQRAGMSLENRLLRALELATQLLPEARCLRVFLGSDRETHTFEIIEFSMPVQRVRTLGYGEAVDREALQRRRAVQLPDATVIPLPESSDDRPVVFAIDWLPRAARDQDDALVSLVAEQFGALVVASEREQREKQLVESLEQQARSFDQFISMTAHELRSPLTSIKGYAQLLVRQARRSGLREMALHSAEAIVEQGTRLADMIEQIHDAARIRRDKLELQCAPTDLVALVRELAESWPATFQRDNIQIEIKAGALLGDWDARRVAQIIQNLVGNAARFSAAETGIMVEVWREDGEAVVCVRDAGVGIPEQDQPHVFEYLYRSAAAEARNLTGLGLGLFVSAQLAERMGGRLWLHYSSTGPASGSEFRLALPLAG